MKRLVAILTLVVCAFACSYAQSNKGSVTVKQSAEIDELVYGKKKVVPKTKEQLKAERKAAKKAEKEARKRAKEEAKLKKAAGEKRQQPIPQQPQKPQPVKPAPYMPALPEDKVVPIQETQKQEETERPRTKIIRRKVKVGEGGEREHRAVVYHGMRKVSGYRIQVFSGGNKRVDRQNAEKMGHKVKAAFPNQPVYVHFHSPRWFCRVGNFPKKEKAQEFLKKVRNAGFKQATLINCIVTVRNAEYIY